MSAEHPTAESPKYGLSEEHRAIRAAVRAVCDAKVAPYAAEVDESGEFPEVAFEALAASDFAAPHIDEEDDADHPGRVRGAEAEVPVAARHR